MPFESPAQLHNMIETDPAIAELMIDLFLETEFTERGGKAYPRSYALARRYPCPPAVVAKMRAVVGRIPRVKADDYDILFNAEQVTWDVVKWLRAPKWIGDVPGLGPMVGVVREPFSVYSIPANRSPLTLGERDWEIMRRNSVTLRDPQALTAELLERNLTKRADQASVQADADRDFADYYRDAYRRRAEELGL